MASDWERFKDEIVWFYLAEGLTLNQVSSQMVREHGFDKKKHQYEYMLKKWKISKNTKKKMWEYVNHIVQKRYKQQKASQVHLHGIQLSDARVRKALQRYGRISLAEKYGAAPSPQSPEGQIIRISSPPAPEKQVVWPEYLPWVQFDRTVQLVHLEIAEPIVDSILRTLATSRLGTHIVDDSAVSTALREPLDWVATLSQTLPHLDDHAGELVASSQIQKPDIIATRAFKALLFQMSNKKLNVKHPLLAQNMMKLIHGLYREIPTAVDSLLDSTDPTSAAVKETLFATVVRFGHSLLVSRFLAAGTNPNNLIDCILRFKTNMQRGKARFKREQLLSGVTPLQVASAAGDMETASVLLEYQAKPDLGDPTPLQIVCSLPPKPDSVKLARLLLQYGAQPDTTRHDILLPPLMQAVACGNKEMVRFLLSEGAADKIVSWDDNRHPSFICPSNLPVYFPYLVDGYPERFLEHLKLYKNHATITALQVATIIHDTNITEMLILSLPHHKDRIDIYRQALVTACLAADEGLVCRFLNLYPGIRDDKVWINSAFCAVAWSLDCRIARIFLRYGVIPQWQEGYIISAIQAAALYGNVGLIRLLHSCGYDINASVMLLPPLTSKSNKILLEHWTPLECAIYLGHSQLAQVLLRLGAWWAASTLNLAIWFGNDELVLDLLARDANITSILHGLHPLQIAVRQRKGLALIRNLVEAGARFQGDELITVVRNNDLDVAGYIMAFGTDILAPSTNGETILDAAAQSGNLRMMQRYFSHGGQYTSKALFGAVKTATATSDHSIVKYLLQCRPSGPMDAYEVTSLVQSILSNNRILVSLFLDLHPGPATSYFCWHTEWTKRPCLQIWDQIGLTAFEPRSRCANSACPSRISPLWAAAHMLQEPLVKDLISRNHPPHAFLLESALHNPSFASEEIRQQLATAYPLSSIGDSTSHRILLRSAIRCNARPDLLQQHISGHKSLDFVRDEYERPCWSSLQLAAGYSNIGCVRILLKAGANINAPATGVFGRTALQAAVEEGNFEMVMLLLKHDADINALGAALYGHTALQLAVLKGDLKMAMLLLDHGADVNGPPSIWRGMTAIEIAAYMGFIDMAGLLLPRVALQGGMRLHFVRAVGFAVQACQYTTAELLKKHGGWTERDDKLATKRQVIERKHTCPRSLYNDYSWTGECGLCDISWHISSTWRSSNEDESIIHLSNSSMGPDQQAADSGLELPAEGLTMLGDPFEELGSIQVTEVAERSLDLCDPVSRWLDDFVGYYFESIE
ncbi:hypothetical protein JX266_014014 [Neoarthrinium moseri]|nr:hypothetical protein JX266_014014 [Neoarthrinium moseri]